MRAALLIFVLVLTTVYGFYLQPNMPGQAGAYQSNEQLFKALSDYFYSLSTGAYFSAPFLQKFVESK
ncbi:hypothetical protein Zmor_005226 [Zophobas morio]|uniref:Uncharacterized protein n=1 Tax=Zophobas morio TaxID=2755281 RepID=A0AA38IPK4_9CUCU|nr:hypothetical protein Zmor_005226 [Zophobas morio]